MKQNLLTNKLFNISNEDFSIQKDSHGAEVWFATKDEQLAAYLFKRFGGRVIHYMGFVAWKIRGGKALEFIEKYIE